MQGAFNPKGKENTEIKSTGKKAGGSGHARRGRTPMSLQPGGKVKGVEGRLKRGILAVLAGWTI